MTALLEAFKRARRISTPIITITSADQEETIQSLMAVLKPEDPVVRYDIARGPIHLNEPGRFAVHQMVGGDLEMAALLAEDPARAMIGAFNTPADTVIFFLNAQRQINDPRVAQAIACMRDLFKQDGRTIVLLAPQITLPEQIAGDVMVLDHPLPETEEISEILDKVHQYTGNQVPPPTPDTRRKAIEAVRGLHAAAIDQAFSFAMEPTGINVADCWSQKRSRIEQTRGLSFYMGGETYHDIGGLIAFKTFMDEIYRGPEPFRLIVWLDEIEKTIDSGSGYRGDGGVSADQLGCTLSNMEDNGWTGAIAVGPPGAGKSIIAKATGNTFRVPCIRMDLGAMKGGIVGESEQLIRQAMKVLLGIAGSGAFFIATCNNLTMLPPELLRRFSLGRTWFFDLPDEDEKRAIWVLNLNRFGLQDTEIPDDTDWTGADIRDCCMGAYRRRRSLVQIARQIVPYAKQRPEALAALRSAANGSYLSASYEGAYVYRSEDHPTPKGTIPNQSTGRKISFN